MIQTLQNHHPNPCHIGSVGIATHLPSPKKSTPKGVNHPPKSQNQQHPHQNLHSLHSNQPSTLLYPLPLRPPSRPKHTPSSSLLFLLSSLHSKEAPILSFSKKLSHTHGQDHSDKEPTSSPRWRRRSRALDHSFLLLVVKGCSHYLLHLLPQILSSHLLFFFPFCVKNHGAIG